MKTLENVWQEAKQLSTLDLVILSGWCRREARRRFDHHAKPSPDQALQIGHLESGAEPMGIIERTIRPENAPHGEAQG